MRKISVMLLLSIAVMFAEGIWTGPNFSDMNYGKINQSAPEAYDRIKTIDNKTMSVNLPPMQNPEDNFSSWFTYGNNPPAFLTWAGPERATHFIPGEFGISYPCTLSKLRATFYYHATYPWPDSAYVFKLYAGDGATLLWVSETLQAKSYPSVCSTDVNPPIVITSGNFYIAVRPRDAGGHPSTLADGVTDGQSFSGEPGAWTAWASGEFFLGAYLSFVRVNWDMRTGSVSAPANTLPYKRFVISAQVENLAYNSAPANTPVKMRITGPSGYIYEDLNEMTQSAITQYDTARIVFSPEWQTPSVLGVYTVKVWTELSGDELPSNDTFTTTINVTNWITYADWDNFWYYTWGGPERATYFMPAELGVIHPLTIDSLKAMFYLGNRPWTDSTFKFKIYKNDGTTLLYESDTIRVNPASQTSQTLVTHYVNPPITITSGDYLVALAPRIDSMPSSCGTNESLGRSYYGTPGTKAWTPWTLGEYFIASFVSWTPRNNDAGVTEIVMPGSQVDPIIAITPLAVVKNFGLDNQTSIPVVCEIRDSSSLVYTGTGTIALNAGDTGTVEFSPDWIPGPSGTVYDITVFSNLSMDENNINDTATSYTSSFIIKHTLYSTISTSMPVIDGLIETSEWADAEKNDVTDVLGMEGIPFWAGSAYLYTKHDSNKLYLACDLPYANSLDDYDQLGVYLDDNNDGVWAVDSSEGNYWLVHYPTGDSVRYRAVVQSNPFTSWVYGAVPASAISVSLTSGHLQFEGAIPLGRDKQNLDVNPLGDTAGLWFFAQDNPDGYRFAYWPQDMPADSWPYPNAYGKLIFRQPLDVGVTSILVPTGTLYNGELVTPKVVVNNFGPIATGMFPVIFNISQGKVGEYSDTVLISLEIGQSDTVDFSQYLAFALGMFTSEAKTALAGDGDISNDMQTGNFEVIESPNASWHLSIPMPSNNMPKLVKDGGAIVAVPGISDQGSAIYGFKGWKSSAFYKFDGVAWIAMESIPWGLKYKPGVPIDSTKWNKKTPGKGASLCWDGMNTIYATKGNGTFEFWAYDLLTGLWSAKAFISGDKGAKGGSCIAYNDGKVYLLLQKQKTTGNFYVYDVLTDAWTALTAPPEGPNAKKWKDGTDLISFDSGTLFALKGGDKYNAFWKYDIISGTWAEFESIPLVHPMLNKKVKVGDGGSIATDGSVVYAIKGAGKQDFWTYTPGTPGVWTASDTIMLGPLMKKGAPKTGAGIAYMDNKVYLLKGNKTDEFWYYGPVYGKANTRPTPISITSPSVMAENTLTGLEFILNVNPNPFFKNTVVRYTVPNAGRVSIKIYNTAGSLITTIQDGYLNAGNYSNTFSTDISGGVYILRYEDNNNRADLKLIVE